MKITVQYIPPALEKREEETRERSGGMPSPDQPRFEYFDIPPSRGVWSKVPLRLRYVRAKPVPEGKDMRQWLWEEYQRTKGKTLSEDERREIWKDPQGWEDRHFENLAKEHGYRRPWFFQSVFYRKHPTLARIFRYFYTLSLKFDPPWNRLELIITRKNPKKEDA